MDRQQVHFAVGMPGPGWSSGDRYAVDVLRNILGGTGGRMFTSLRDRDGLAYSVAPILSYGKNRGLIGAYIACSHEKLPAAEAGIWRELEEMAARGPTSEEMIRSKNYIKGNHVMELQSGESQASTMALMELYGVGHNAWLEYPRHVEGVDARAVTAAARRFLDKNYAQTVLVGL
jgi:zinc protease